MRDMLRTMVEHVGPAAMRYPRGKESERQLIASLRFLGNGKANCCGTVANSFYPRRRMESWLIRRLKRLTTGKNGIEATVRKCPFWLKPLDYQLLLAWPDQASDVTGLRKPILLEALARPVLELLEENGLQDFGSGWYGWEFPIGWLLTEIPKLCWRNNGLDVDGYYTRVRESVEVLEIAAQSRKEHF